MMPTRLPTTLLLLAASLLLLVGCGVPRPDDAIAKPGVALSSLDSRSGLVRDVRIQARADYYDEAEGKRVAGRELIISALQPDQLRVTLNSFGSTIAALASDGQTVTMLDLHNNVFYRGPATPENISKLLPLYLSGADFFRVLTGGFPVDDLAADWRDKAELAWDSDDGRYQLSMPRLDGGEQRVELTYPDLGVAEIKVSRDGKTIYSYEAKEHRELQGIQVPAKSRFNFPERDVEVTLFIDEYDANVDPAARIFQIRPPPNAQIVNL